MDYSKILGKYYSGYAWICGETYVSLKWLDETLAKPTEAELESLWEDLLLEEMREERNRLLKDCDCKVLVDYPNKNKKAWLSYRRKLRDFPTVWTEGTPFPEKPE